MYAIDTNSSYISYSRILINCFD